MENSTSFVLNVVEYPEHNGWNEPFLGCLSWQPINHVLFQVGNAVLSLGLLAPDTTYGILCLHACFTFGFLLLSIWSWVILCAPDFFSWNFAFVLMNGFQALFLMYHIRPVIFCAELEDLYIANFQPLRVARSTFKKLVCPHYCTLLTLNKGDSYCIQAISKTDKLGLLLTGIMSVHCNQNFLHHIKAKQFIDSPEFESSVTGEEKFQVSIVAESSCRYIFWPRQSLEYLLLKEPSLVYVMNVLLGRDITNKLYALNEKVVTPSGSRLDIRLPSVSNTIKTRHDIRKAVVGIPNENNFNELHVNCIDDNDGDESDDNGENIELLSANIIDSGEKVELLNVNIIDNSETVELLRVNNIDNSEKIESLPSQLSLNSRVHFEM